MLKTFLFHTPASLDPRFVAASGHIPIKCSSNRRLAATLHCVVQMAGLIHTPLPLSKLLESVCRRTLSIQMKIIDDVFHVLKTKVARVMVIL